MAKKYPYKRMKVDGKCIDRHRLVMEKKLGRKLGSWELVHHKDEDKTNDHPDNLELTTRSKHAKHHVTQAQIDRFTAIPKSCGSSNGSAKLTEADIPAIRKKLSQGVLGKILADEYGVNPTTISDIKLGKKWKHIK